ncbi:MAG: DNA/RNA non-specific endonuclease [Bacteroidales bacterium]|nr:DNA/RNA non-specific endonuclease [Bacteroidales bacterium]
MARPYRDKLSWTRTLLLCAVAGLLIYLLVVVYDQTAKADAAPEPVAAGVIPSARELMEVSGANGIPVAYSHFRVNFNPQLHIPNHVAWELTAAETEGGTERGTFTSDPDIEGCATKADYTGSGYDRGHMAPAADMKFSPEAMAECFLMTNIAPQSHALNGGAWKKLEEKCRQWACADSAIIIVCGPVLTPEPTEFIGRNRVAVPNAFFKVILSPFANPPRAIGFIMPNARVEGGMQAAAVSVDSVEAITGLDFFSALPDSIEAIVEQQNNFHYWTTLKK